MKKRFGLAVVALALTISPAAAWSDLGHMTIAAAAYGLLTPEARARVDVLMRLHPSYAGWTVGVDEADRGRVAFVHAATWPDDIKRDPSYTKDEIGDAGASANLGFADKAVHGYWHYADLPYSIDGTPTHPPAEPNAIERLRLFARVLASDASDEVKSYDLAWTIHLVGDAHQPLHTTARFSPQIPKGDAGGNAETVTVGGKEKTLHAFWDGLLGGRGTPEKAIRIAAKKTNLQGLAPVPATDLDPMKWFEEGNALARQWVYTDEIGDGKGPFALRDGYRRAARDLASRQAAVAAQRLAGFLDDALGR